MDINQVHYGSGDNIAGNKISINNGLLPRELDLEAKAILLEFIQEEKISEIQVIVVDSDEEASRYADQIINFLNEDNYPVKRLRSLSRLRFLDGTSFYGQMIQRSPDDESIVQFYIGHRKSQK